MFPIPIPSPIIKRPKTRTTTEKSVPINENLKPFVEPDWSAIPRMQSTDDATIARFLPYLSEMTPARGATMAAPTDGIATFNE